MSKPRQRMPDCQQQGIAAVARLYMCQLQGAPLIPNADYLESGATVKMHPEVFSLWFASIAGGWAGRVCFLWAHKCVDGTRCGREV